MAPFYMQVEPLIYSLDRRRHRKAVGLCARPNYRARMSLNSFPVRARRLPGWEDHLGQGWRRGASVCARRPDSIGPRNRRDVTAPVRAGRFGVQGMRKFWLLTPIAKKPVYRPSRRSEYLIWKSLAGTTLPPSSGPGRPPSSSCRSAWACGPTLLCGVCTGRQTVGLEIAGWPVHYRRTAIWCSIRCSRGLDCS